MDTYELDHNTFKPERSNLEDDKLFVRFFIKAHQNTGKSEEAGRPIFDDAEYIQIMVPGDKENIIIRPVRPTDKERFARRYQAWKATGVDGGVSGTPLELWPELTLGQIEEVKYFGIRTVEQMSELRDDVAMKVPGFMSLKQAAGRFVAAKKLGPTNDEMSAELAKRDEIIMKMQAKLAELEPALESEPAPVPAPARRRRRAAISA